ncbi:hypothetical protein [Streptomyces sp. NPDC088350]|uniref:hypothetical protein n=1 Tax=Streptomyces sp. NPDC088350 TaxID=3365854 RepID=UPI00380358DB
MTLQQQPQRGDFTRLGRTRQPRVLRLVDVLRRAGCNGVTALRATSTSTVFR